MTSDSAIRANQKNAKASTGPRTRAGKRQSSQNARKHGLTANDPNPGISAEVEHFAKQILGRYHADPAIFEAARDVADAHFQLRRIQTFRTALQWSAPPTKRFEFQKIAPLVADPFVEFLQKLESLDRYERRALSRRKFAIRRFYELVA